MYSTIKHQAQPFNPLNAFKIYVEVKKFSLVPLSLLLLQLLSDIFCHYHKLKFNFIFLSCCISALHTTSSYIIHFFLYIFVSLLPLNLTTFLSYYFPIPPSPITLRSGNVLAWMGWITPAWPTLLLPKCPAGNRWISFFVFSFPFLSTFSFLFHSVIWSFLPSFEWWCRQIVHTPECYTIHARILNDNNEKMVHVTGCGWLSLY